MTHRGGINADGKTGDGCGLLIQKPDLFLRAVAREAFSVDLPEQYAVGMVFFNQDPVSRGGTREHESRDRRRRTGAGRLAQRCRSIPAFSAAWRWSACRRSNRCSSAAPGLSDQDFAIKLFSARRRSSVANAADSDHYICSFSHKTIIYKG